MTDCRRPRRRVGRTIAATPPNSPFRSLSCRQPAEESRDKAVAGCLLLIGGRRPWIVVRWRLLVSVPAEVSVLRGLRQRAAAFNLPPRHLFRPHHTVTLDQVMGLAWVVPVSDRGVKRKKARRWTRKFPMGRRERGNDFRAAAAAASVHGGAVLERNVENPVLQCARDGLYNLWRNLIDSLIHVFSSALTSECVPMV